MQQKLSELISKLNVIQQKIGDVEIELHALMADGEHERELYYPIEFLFDNNENDEIYKILGSPSITNLN